MLTMASKAFPFFSFTLFLIILLSHYSEGQKRSSPFQFIEHLKGCQKGDNLKGINALKKYLHKFGYLNQAHANGDDFDELLESAIKTYQLNFNLKTTGVLDDNTVAKMTTPRCGVPDIINGKTRMHAGLKQNNNQQHGSTTVSLYSFFDGNPRWPADKYSLTYAFKPGTREDAINPVEQAFQTWAENSQFTFSQTQDFANADLKVSFESGDHGDMYPFDGRGGPDGILAHAFAPTDGRFHYDADEQWSAGAEPGAYDLETVALHEIGHLLGLDHSSVESAIMYPSIAPGVTKGLDEDDVEGISALYGQ